MQIRSILVALGREGDPAQVLARAVMLARRFGARLELFLCEAEQAYALQHQYDADSSEVVRQSGLVRLHAWMDQLWRSLDINDVPVNMEAVYESPLCEAISQKAARSKPDLVVRGIGTRGHRTFSVSDLDLGTQLSGSAAADARQALAVNAQHGRRGGYFRGGVAGFDSHRAARG